MNEFADRPGQLLNNPLTPPATDRMAAVRAAKAAKREAAVAVPVPQRVATGAPAAASAPETEPEAPPSVMQAARERKPFGVARTRLDFPEREGYVRHIFNDTPGRIARAKEAGYEHVMDEMNRPTSISVGTAERGGGMMGYLMEIPQEFHDVDFAQEQAALDQTDRTIMRGKLDVESGDSRYTPPNTINVRVERGRK